VTQGQIIGGMEGIQHQQGQGTGSRQGISVFTVDDKVHHFAVKAVFPHHKDPWFHGCTSFVCIIRAFPYKSKKK
jgi:hypothetical protein